MLQVGSAPSGCETQPWFPVTAQDLGRSVTVGASTRVLGFTRDPTLLGLPLPTERPGAAAEHICNGAAPSCAPAGRFHHLHEHRMSL